jgi:hypothetical protein
VDLGELKQQINDMLDSNMPENSKAGLHNLLGEIRDQIEDLEKLSEED